MPEATLTGPRSLTTQGHSFARGVPITVSREVALALDGNPRFKVTGLDKTADEQAQTRTGKKTVDRSRAARIRAACDKLDVDNDKHYLENGTPNPQAVSNILGFTVTEEDIEKALRTAQPDEQLPDEAETRVSDTEAGDGSERGDLSQADIKGKEALTRTETDTKAPLDLKRSAKKANIKIVRNHKGAETNVEGVQKDSHGNPHVEPPENDKSTEGAVDLDKE